MNKLQKFSILPAGSSQPFFPQRSSMTKIGHCCCFAFVVLLCYLLFSIFCYAQMKTYLWVKSSVDAAVKLTVMGPVLLVG
ncbi:hypothetical protein L1987_30351 [Smallanthus sonchifolius]|uniref:Uncharacterized protein n=1 Tax=Smallanthus sonchifolius TaxID=185202 RepID=A0ACB9I391_9ASTR|nr:hypothetical protein L1987_30351 [Smallanthus sonchifolius]